MNGAKEGDDVYGERGETIIDYVMGDRGAWERVERLEVGDEVDSNHQSVTVWLGKGEEGNEEEEGVERMAWSGRFLPGRGQGKNLGKEQRR